MYEYRCPVCGRGETVLRGILDMDYRVPVCNDHGASVEMELVPSAPSTFIFKGAGFHRNDYPNGRR